MKAPASLLLGLFLLAGLFSAAPRKAPELAFTIPGQGDKILSQYHGKVVALEFILTTCPHCQSASRYMSQLQGEYGYKGFQAIDLAINPLDEGATKEQAGMITETFANSFQCKFPVGYLSREQMMSFVGFSILDRMVVPQLVLIDRQGVIRYQTPAGDSDEYGKMMNEATIKQHIEELLGH